MNSQDSGLSQSKPITVSIPEAMRLTGIGRTMLYQFINKGRLPIVKVGTRTLVRVDALDAFLKSLEVSQNFGNTREEQARCTPRGSSAHRHS